MSNSLSSGCGPIRQELNFVFKKMNTLVDNNCADARSKELTKKKTDSLHLVNMLVTFINIGNLVEASLGIFLLKKSENPCIPRRD
jgi:hypothetical protein